MKEAVLRRSSSGEQGTFGTLEVDGKSFHSGELPWNNNASGKSCVPAGQYTVRWSPSAKYGEKYQLQDVPGRTSILIHSANYVGDEDKGWKAQVDGCVALGNQYGKLEGQFAVLDSGDAVREFEDLMGKEDFLLTIIDEWEEAGEPGAGNDRVS